MISSAVVASLVIVFVSQNSTEDWACAIRKDRWVPHSANSPMSLASRDAANSYQLPYNYITPVP